MQSARAYVRGPEGVFAALVQSENIGKSLLTVHENQDTEQTLQFHLARVSVDERDAVRSPVRRRIIGINAFLFRSAMT
jgi:hypothetical protein